MDLNWTSQKRATGWLFFVFFGMIIPMRFLWIPNKEYPIFAGSNPAKVKQEGLGENVRQLILQNYFFHGFQKVKHLARIGVRKAMKPP